MTNDYAKKEESSHRMRVRPSKNSKKQEVSSDEEEEDEKSEEEEYIPSESEHDPSEDDESSEGSAASASEEDCEESVSVSPSKALAGMKRKKEVKKSKDEKRKRRRHEDMNNNEMEVKHPSLKQEKQTKKEVKEAKDNNKENKNKEKESNSKDDIKEPETDKKGKKESPIFNDRNVDLDLFNSSPNNVVAKKVKVANNLMVTCRNIDQIEGARSAGVTYDFAALTFQRKTANDKMFEFVVPLGLAPGIKKAIDHIVEHNPKFFTRQ